ncbi:Retinol dehydrogenase 12 [Orchesella cincta]|uniref:Retinol dehydrogenase 12 n=1 Tax=Orchesella cincta TaxID=48709 RepID=A0A1D2MX31_ORCCI|nr:Retinol dehydrogenase 12 [Orchesella cincta]
MATDTNGSNGKNKEMESKISASESKQRLHEKIQRPPGSWLARKVKTIWYMFYGLLVLTLRLKFFREVFSRHQRYDPSSEPRRPGEVVVITGGPRGIAYELAKKFLKMDFIVIMGVRDVTASQTRVDQIRQQGVFTGTIHLLPLNLKSLAATKEFADGVLKITNRIDFLINNAGVMMTPYECTEDGYESNFKEVYASPKSYFDSKLCIVMFTKQLEKRLQEEKANIHTYSVHPGAIPTDLWSEAGGFHSFVSCFLKPLLPDMEDGADAIIYAALSSKLESKGGSYLERLRLTNVSSRANNVYNQEVLWSRSEFFCQALV